MENDMEKIVYKFEGHEVTTSRELYEQRSAGGLTHGLIDPSEKEYHMKPQKCECQKHTPRCNKKATILVNKTISKGNKITLNVCRDCVRCV